MKVGIWIDKRIAKVVAIEKGNEQLVLVESNVEEYHPKGGSGTRQKGGPQDVIQDSKYAERKKHQTKSYFNRVISLLPDFDSLVIFGPSITGQKFADELTENYPNLDKKLRGVEVADSMTNNQVKAWVRDYFS